MDVRRGFLSDEPKSKLNSTVDPAAGGEDEEVQPESEALDEASLENIPAAEQSIGDIYRQAVVEHEEEEGHASESLSRTLSRIGSDAARTVLRPTARLFDAPLWATATNTS